MLCRIHLVSLTLPFAFSQLGALITLAIHSLGGAYGNVASLQMVMYERRKTRALASGRSFHEEHFWWSNGIADGSFFISLLNSPMAIWERIVLYVWYFIFGFGQLASFVYLQMRGPTADRDTPCTFRYRWVLLVGQLAASA